MVIKVKKMKRFKRSCKRCKKIYLPKDKHGNLCEGCKKKSTEKAKIKRKKTWEEKWKKKNQRE